MRRIKLSLSVVLTGLMTLPAGAASVSGVICVEADGQIAFERHGCCCPGESGATSPASDGMTNHDAADSDSEWCLPCVDIPVLAGLSDFVVRSSKASKSGGGPVSTVAFMPRRTASVDYGFLSNRASDDVGFHSPTHTSSPPLRI